MLCTDTRRGAAELRTWGCAHRGEPLAPRVSGREASWTIPALGVLVRSHQGGVGGVPSRAGQARCWKDGEGGVAVLCVPWAPAAPSISVHPSLHTPHTCPPPPRRPSLVLWGKRPGWVFPRRQSFLAPRSHRALEVRGFVPYKAHPMHRVQLSLGARRLTQGHTGVSWGLCLPTFHRRTGDRGYWQAPGSRCPAAGGQQWGAWALQQGWGAGLGGS